MNLELKEWLHLLLRWSHVFAGILWVGTTYYFTWLDGRFAELEKRLKEKAAANEPPEKQVWMVHSGGFYVVEKLKVPKVMPEKLQWFRWEAALTVGKPPDDAEALRAKKSSKHNTFLVVPVVFMMISNHFPSITYGRGNNWVILSLLVLLGWGGSKLLRRV